MGERDREYRDPANPPGLRPAQQLAKRVFDIIVTSALLVLMAPVLVALVIAELFACGRPVIFRQDRVTCLGRIVKSMKFRTIRSSRSSDSQWTVDDEECSPLGRWLRTTHLDELPQLLNVIRGDMSLVGPRPERPFFTALFARTIPHYEDRLRTRAGLTGWAQVHGLTGDTSIVERVRFDNYYIDHWSLWLDISILIRTLGEPVAGTLRLRRARKQGAPMTSSATAARRAEVTSLACKAQADMSELHVLPGQAPYADPVRTTDDGAP